MRSTNYNFYQSQSKELLGYLIFHFRKKVIGSKKGNMYIEFNLLSSLTNLNFKLLFNLRYLVHQIQQQIPKLSNSKICIFYEFNTDVWQKVCLNCLSYKQSYNLLRYSQHPRLLSCSWHQTTNSLINEFF